MAKIPTIEIRQGDRHLIVNACDLPQWEAEGWKRPEPPKDEPPKDEPPKDEPPKPTKPKK